MNDDPGSTMTYYDNGARANLVFHAFVSTCRRCAAHFAKAGNGSTVNKVCQAG